jgi:hypothetical protein
MRPKRDHQFNGLECLSVVVALCRRELTPATTPLDTIGLEAEIVRLQCTLRQRERECAEHLTTIQQLRQTRSELEHQLSEAACGMYHSVLPELPVDSRGRDAGEWHLAARTLQTHVSAYKRAIDTKSEEYATLKKAYCGLMTLLSAPDREIALAAVGFPACSSTEAP